MPAHGPTSDSQRTSKKEPSCGWSEETPSGVVGALKLPVAVAWGPQILLRHADCALGQPLPATITCSAEAAALVFGLLAGRCSLGP